MLKKITYDKTSPIIDEVIKWIMKKEISEVDKTEFIDPRKIAAPDEICNGAIRKARKSEKIKLTKQVQRKLTDKEIAEKYNPDLTDKENAANINIGLTRLKEWKKEYINSIESKEDRVKRLYDPSLSWAKNEEIIGYSINTIKKYLKMREPIAVDLGTPELETADSENQITECIDIDNSELLTENAEIIAPSPDPINTRIKIDCETTDDENLFDEDNAELIRWVNDFKFEDEVDMEMDIECQDIDSDESIEHLVKMEEPIAIDVRTAELETEECENLFDGKIDLENDDFCRWMFGDEFMEEIERERKRNALIYGTEEVVKMVV